MINFNNNRQLLGIISLTLSVAFMLSGCDNMEKDNIVSNFNLSDSLGNLESQINEAESNKINKDNKPVIQPKIKKEPAKELAFIGCYAVVKKAKAQLKISELENLAGNKTGKLSLQMKEPRSAKRVWDDPDSLEFVSLEEASLYFDVDVLNIDRMVARPDRLFVLAHVKTGNISINASDQNSIAQNSNAQNNSNPKKANPNDDEVADGKYLVYFSDGSDNADKSLDEELVGSIDNSTENSTGKSETKKTKVKHTPIKPNANVIYPVKCDKRKVNIL